MSSFVFRTTLVHTQPAQATQTVVEGDLTIIIGKDHHVKDHSPG